MKQAYMFIIYGLGQQDKFGLAATKDEAESICKDELESMPDDIHLEWVVVGPMPVVSGSEICPS